MGAGTSGGRPSGRPPFVSYADVENISPFERLPWAGYENYLAEIDDEMGTYLKMLTPGASGSAMAVTAVNPYVCCQDNTLEYALESEKSGEVLLFPAIVHWRSLVGDDGMLLPGLGRTFHESLTFPPVGVSDLWCVDGSFLMAWTNQVMPDECYDIDEPTSVDNGEPITGIMAPWQLLPITPKAEELLYEEMLVGRTHAQTQVFGLSNCELSEYGYDEIYGSTYELETVHEGHDRCRWYMGEPTCDCGGTPTHVHVFEALLRELDTPEINDLFVPRPLYPAWALLQDRYLTAWETVHDRSGQGDTWSTSSWRRLSPFSDSSSLARQRQVLSVLSTASPTSPASLRGSSRPSMPYAS